MSRKGVGLAAFDRSRITSAQYASHGNNLRSSHSTSLATQLSVFRSLLQQFAQTHAKDIRSNPSFRAQFARMCAAIGVDPLLASSTSGGGRDGGSVWSQLLGGTVNDFYFELAVGVVGGGGRARGGEGGGGGARAGGGGGQGFFLGGGGGGGRGGGGGGGGEGGGVGGGEGGGGFEEGGGGGGGGGGGYRVGGFPYLFLGIRGQREG